MILFGSANFFLFVFWIVCALPVIRIAKLCRQSTLKWGLIGLICGPFSFIGAVMMPDKSKQPQ